MSYTHHFCLDNGSLLDHANAYRPAGSKSYKAVMVFYSQYRSHSHSWCTLHTSKHCCFTLELKKTKRLVVARYRGAVAVSPWFVSEYVVKEYVQTY
jgi:hypothetical protein